MNSLPLPKLHTFSNGFRCIHQQTMSSLPISSIYVYVDAGSVWEHLCPDKIPAGACHFIEHMCFKGTDRMKLPIEIYNVFDTAGAYFNAFTEKQYTTYKVAIANTSLERAIFTLSEILLHSTFPQEYFDKEEQVVIEENIKAENSANNIINDMMESILHKGNAFEYPIDHISYHTPLSKKKFHRRDILRVYDSLYRPERMILSITTNVETTHLRNILQKSLFSKPYAKKSPIPLPFLSDMVFQKPIQTLSESPKIHIRKKAGLTTTTCMITFRTCSQYSDDRFIFDLLNPIMGGLLSSRLFRILRDEHGLTYSSDCQNESYSDTGYFSFYAIVDKSKLFYNAAAGGGGRRGFMFPGGSPPPRGGDLILGGGQRPGLLPLLLETIQDLIQNGIRVSEYNKVQKYIYGNLLLSLEDSSTLSEYNGIYVLLYAPTTSHLASSPSSLLRLHPSGDKYVSGTAKHRSTYIPLTQKYNKIYRKITRKEIQDVLRKYFIAENMNICIVSSQPPSLQDVKSFITSNYG